MFRYDSRLLTLLLFVGFLAACNGDKDLQMSLLLQISTDSSEFHVSDYRVSDDPFKKSYQQGNYQALMLDGDGKKLREITFQKIEKTGIGDDHSGFSVSLPMLDNLHRVAIYRLDGRSGHYQRPDEALLTWSLPDSVKEKSETDN